MRTTALTVACYLSAIGTLGATLLVAQTLGPKYPPKSRVQIPGVQHEMAELVPVATFAVEGRPDWMAVAPGAVWVTSSKVNHVFV